MSSCTRSHRERLVWSSDPGNNTLRTSKYGGPQTRLFIFCLRFLAMDFIFFRSKKSPGGNFEIPSQILRRSHFTRRNNMVHNETTTKGNHVQEHHWKRCCHSRRCRCRLYGWPHPREGTAQRVLTVALHDDFASEEIVPTDFLFFFSL
jgi:hypothetical protein